MLLQIIFDYRMPAQYLFNWSLSVFALSSVMAVSQHRVSILALDLFGMTSGHIIVCSVFCLFVYVLVVFPILCFSEQNMITVIKYKNTNPPFTPHTLLLL